MTNTVQLKRSNVPNSVPGAANLVPGELAINYSDGNLFYKNTSNVVTVIASNKFLSVTGNVTAGNITSTGPIQSGNVVYTNVAGLANQVLTLYANGVTYWANSSSGSGNSISNGTSNVLIANANGNVTMAVDSVANSVVVSSGSLFVQGPIATPKVINTLALVANAVNAVMISPLTISAAGNIFVPTDSTLTIFTPA